MVGVVAAFTVVAAVVFTVVAVECGRVEEVALAAGPFRPLQQGMEQREALPHLDRDLATALQVARGAIFRVLAAVILQTGMSV